MADTRLPWDRLDGESQLWFRRFERYRFMGPKRSKLAVYREERVAKQQVAERRAAAQQAALQPESGQQADGAEAAETQPNTPTEPLAAAKRRKKAEKGGMNPVSIPASWDKKAAEFRWVERAAAWDTFEVEREREEREAEERRNREQARQIRRNLLGAGHNLLAKSMMGAMGPYAQALDMQDIMRLMSAIEKFNRDSRSEYGDLPEQHLNVHKSADTDITVDDITAADAAIEAWERERFGSDTEDGGTDAGDAAE